MPTPPFERTPWLRPPLSPDPRNPAIFDTFELLTPPLVRVLLEHAPIHALVPSDAFAAAILGRPPLLTWAERTSLIHAFPLASIIEVDSLGNLSTVVSQLQPRRLLSRHHLPLSHTPIRSRSSVTAANLIRRIHTLGL